MKALYRCSAQEEPSVIKEGANAAEDFSGKKRKGHVHNLSDIGDKGFDLMKKHKYSNPLRQTRSHRLTSQHIDGVPHRRMAGIKA